MIVDILKHVDMKVVADLVAELSHGRKVVKQLFASCTGRYFPYRHRHQLRVLLGVVNTAVKTMQFQSSLRYLA